MGADKGTCGAIGATGYRKRRDARSGISDGKVVAETMRRFLNALNTPAAVLAVLVVVVAVNVFLYLDYRSSEEPTSSPPERSSGPQRATERTDRPSDPEEPTRPQGRAQPASSPSPGQSATASA